MFWVPWVALHSSLKAALAYAYTRSGRLTPFLPKLKRWEHSGLVVDTIVITTSVYSTMTQALRTFVHEPGSNQRPLALVVRQGSMPVPRASGHNRVQSAATSGEQHQPVGELRWFTLMPGLFPLLLAP